MDRDSLMKMDPNILLSIVNMKLRDNFNSLEDFCEDIGIKEIELCEKLESTGCSYSKESNQFK